ncbi:hypothetical protein NL676_004219 [Syzygium grande]|nr:hypothetical protein NL676_004219 [Syzygium grande]
MAAAHFTGEDRIGAQNHPKRKRRGAIQGNSRNQRTTRVASRRGRPILRRTEEPTTAGCMRYDRNNKLQMNEREEGEAIPDRRRIGGIAVRRGGWFVSGERRDLSFASAWFRSPVAILRLRRGRNDESSIGRG